MPGGLMNPNGWWQPHGAKNKEETLPSPALLESVKLSISEDVG